MSGDIWLNWLILTVSLFNTMILLWLGMTVVLNAEHRTWGNIVLAGGGLLLGGAFFVSHTAILGQGLRTISTGMNFWWYVGWIPVIALPFAWYVVMLWHTGFWKKENRPSKEYRWQRAWFGLVIFLAVVMGGLFLFANPLPSYSQVAQLNLSDTPTLAGIPLLALVYPLYCVMCIGLSLDVIRRPAPSERVMGDLARGRARPWLAAASVVLLLVSLMVAWAILWIIMNARQRSLYNLYNDMETSLLWFDLIIASLIAVAVLLLGQAIVSYEIFTGKTLPRQGLKRQWYSVIMLAAGYGTMVGWILANQVRPIYGLLLTTILMTVFYALYSWRAYAERERYIDHLRPFVTSQRLYDYLLTGSSSAEFATNFTTPPEMDMETPFRALCENVLGARVAYLVALGPLSPLVGTALAYPNKALATSLPPLSEIAAQLTSPQAICLPLDPIYYGGAMWAVPLWSERGLIGVLLLGEKSSGGLYSQEEIEIARASGERLIDTQATAQIAQRLMALQRQRLVESQLLDRRTRRVLHDEVLPLLHTAMLSLSSQPALRRASSGEAEASSSSSEALTLLTDAHHQISNLLRDMPATAAPKVSQLGLVGALKQALDDELGNAFDDIIWEIEPEATRQAQSIPLLTAEVLFYAAREAIRNAARYGRPTPVNGKGVPLFHLQVNVKWENGLEIQIEDNGVGLGAAKASNEGSGQGLALHTTLMAVVGGSMVMESLPGSYTRVLLTLPEGSW